MSAVEKVAATLQALEGVIENPANPNHLMVVKPVREQVEVYLGDVMLAKSTSALRVLEIGSSVYDPMIYIPVGDLVAVLTPKAKTSTCPLKGEASYLSFNGEEIAWQYNPYAFSDVLADHVCFWPSKVRLIEGPANA